MDLSGILFVDHHAHPLTREQPRTPDDLRAHFSEAHSPILAREHVDSAAHYRWALRQLAAALGVNPTAEDVLAYRCVRPQTSYARELAQKTNLACMLLDEGYPPPTEAHSSAELQDMLGVPVYRILRLEVLVQDLLLRERSLTTLVESFDAILSDLRRAGYVALKSIAAYRTGLNIEPVAETAAETAFNDVRAVAMRHGSIRLTSKPLVDFFVWRALGHAAAQGIPFQFHTGYGDPDLDLRLANPLHLRPLFEAEALSDAPIVLLHASYPYTREAAYLAAVYPNAYLDISFSLPPLDRLQLTEALAAALGTAPASKLLCSSDGACIPEHYYLGAVRARQLVSQVLGQMQELGELSAEDAQEMGGMLLRANALRLYRLALPAADSH